MLDSAVQTALSPAHLQSLKVRVPEFPARHRDGEWRQLPSAILLKQEGPTSYKPTADTQLQVSSSTAHIQYTECIYCN